MSLLLLFSGASLPGVNASLNETLGAVTLSGSAQVIDSAALNETLGAVTLAGTASVGQSNNASLNETLGAVTLSGAAAVAVSAALNKILGAITLSGTVGSVTLYLRSSAHILGRSTLWLPIPFPAIASDETDYRAFDITKDVGEETVTELNFVCALRPAQDGSDPAPQSRVTSSSMHTTLITIEGPNNTQITHSGLFAVAEVGGFPATAIGCRYDLIAEFTLSSGRTLSRQATIMVTR